MTSIPPEAIEAAKRWTSEDFRHFDPEVRQVARALLDAVEHRYPCLDCDAAARHKDRADALTAEVERLKGDLKVANAERAEAG